MKIYTKRTFAWNELTVRNFMSAQKWNNDNNKKIWRLRCIATWSPPTSHQSFWGLITRHLMHQPTKSTTPQGNLVGCVAQLAERRSLAGELTLSCARPAGGEWPLCG